MINGKKISLFAAFMVCILLLVNETKAQTSTLKKYPQGYFRNPLNIPIELTANFGELRSTHWHMGLDIRTQQKVNLPVIASADGYVAHIGIRSMSFGRFIIINHPNGYSTLYAHLNGFFPKLENFVRQKQNEKESWAIELDFNEEQFPVKKGDIIGLSGNTGSSQGPHLHFEITDTKTGRSLNPLLFGFDLKDNIPPTISGLAIYDRSISTYMQVPQIISLKKTDSGYYTRPALIQTGSKKLSFAIDSYDKLTGSVSRDGIYSSTFYFDDIPQVEFVLDNMSYLESDYVNAHVDQKFKNNGGSFLQHLSKLPGFRGPVYKEINGNGIIELNDTTVHTVRIDVIDVYDNLSQLFFTLQYKEGLPGIKKYSDSNKEFLPNHVNVVEEKEFEAYLPEICLYDTVPYFYFRQNNFSEGSISAMHQLSDPLYHLHGSMSIRIKPTKEIASNQLNKVIMQKTPIAIGGKGNRTYRRVEWQSGWFDAEFGDFGNFQLFVDETAPQINAPGKGTDTLNLSALNKIVFTPKDNFGIRSFRAELNDKWLMFSNDKGVNYIYEFDEQCPFGVHKLKVVVEDLVGNVIEKTWWIKREPYTPPPKKLIKRKTSSKKKR